MLNTTIRLTDCPESILYSNCWHYSLQNWWIKLILPRFISNYMLFTKHLLDLIMIWEVTVILFLSVLLFQLEAFQYLFEQQLDMKSFKFGFTVVSSCVVIISFGFIAVSSCVVIISFIQRPFWFSTQVYKQQSQLWIFLSQYCDKDVCMTKLP